MDRKRKEILRALKTAVAATRKKYPRFKGICIYASFAGTGNFNDVDMMISIFFNLQTIS